MNDQRFTELLNLHLDREISTAEIAELEAELNRHPARRRQHAAYRRMQHACAQLFEREHAQAPASFALAKDLLDVERKAAAPRRAIRRPLVAAFAGLAAMAASVALVLMRTVPVSVPIASAGNSAPPAASMAVAAAPTGPANPLVTLANYVPAPAARDGYQTVALVAPGSNGLVRAEFTGWTPLAELPPLQPVVVEDFPASPRPMAQPVMAISRGQEATAPAVQTAAFQFQR